MIINFYHSMNMYSDMRTNTGPNRLSKARGSETYYSTRVQHVTDMTLARPPHSKRANNQYLTTLLTRDHMHFS